MLIKNEKQLLNFVKYSPIIVIAFIAIVVNILIFVQNQLNYQRDLKLYEQNYIETNKKIIKDQIDGIYNNILDEKSKLENNLKKRLQRRVNEAYNVVDNLNKKFSHLGKERLTQIIKESLRELKFNDGRGYFYIINFDGNLVMHPIQPWLEGKNFLKEENSRILKGIINNLKLKEEHFTTYSWYKPNQGKKLYKKITVNRKYEPLGLIIGTGEYLDDFEEDIKKFVLNEYIKQVSFGKNSYVFIVNYKGKYLSHVKKEYVGKNRINLKDVDGYEITKQIINTAKKGSGYLKYVATVMPETGKPAAKTTYVRGIDEWGWAIATGFYDKDLQQYLKNKEEELQNINSEILKKNVLISLFLTIVLLFVAAYISRILKLFFDNYNKKIRRGINLNRKKDSILYQQSKMASMGEMIGNIAHQWRQPLSLISTAASKIKFEDELGVSTKESTYNSLDMIIKSTKYLSQTIEDFRDFFNPNKVAVEFNIKETFDKTIKLISARFATKDIKIISNVEDITIVSYENELIQVLINILNNAVDAFENNDIEKKYIFIDIKKTNECEALNDKIKDSCLSISIKDNAGGIKEEIKPKIFEAYFTTKHKSQGTGIGLYMTYQIITRHLFGNIKVENSKFTFEDKTYKGAKFSILLPLT